VYRYLILLVATLLGLTASTLATEAPDRAEPTWKEGTHYEKIDPPQKASPYGSKVEVDEVFWYSCAHCFELEPFVVSWTKKQPSFVDFQRIPATWTAAETADAKLYYTLKFLGREDLHQAVFDSIHLAKQPLQASAPDETYRLQSAFAAAHGIDPREFRRAYNSTVVSENLRRADQITRAYQIPGVPTFVVNGRFRTDAGQAGGPQNLMTLVNHLADIERDRVSSPTIRRPSSGALH
jgi:protein dithiol oxidoreductase (disulfide-forming)